MAISFQVLPERSAIEADLRAAPGRARLLVHGNGRRDVLQRRARAVEHRDLVRPVRPGRRPETTSPARRGPAPASSDPRPGRAAAHRSRRTARARRRPASSSPSGPARAPACRALRAHRGDEGPRAHVSGLTNARRDGVQVTHTSLPPSACADPWPPPRAGRGWPGPRRHALGPRVIDVEYPRAPQREDRGDRGQLHLALDAAAHDRGRPGVAAGEELRRDRGRGRACAARSRCPNRSRPGARRCRRRPGPPSPGSWAARSAGDCRGSSRWSWRRSSFARPGTRPP